MSFVHSLTKCGANAPQRALQHSLSAEVRHNWVMPLRRLSCPTPTPPCTTAQWTRVRAQGFSLIELMIVVSIVAVIAAIAMPSFLTTVQNSRVGTTADSVRDAVMLGRTEAIRRGATITLSGAGTPAWSSGWRLLDASGTLIREGQFSSGVNVTMVNAPAGANNIVFRPNGTINNTPNNEMYLLVQGAAGSTATPRAVRLNRGVSVCRQGDSNCPI